MQIQHKSQDSFGREYSWTVEGRHIRRVIGRFDGPSSQQVIRIIPKDCQTK